MSPFQETTKRIIDILLGTLGLILCAPVIAAAAIYVKWDSKGPVFFRSRRTGRHGQEFDLLKLRTMHAEQDPLAATVTSETDPRITMSGRQLRRLKIDELPQFLNVVIGNISLVGPRPEAPKYVAHFPEAFRKILQVRPGLTDRATLDFINEERQLASQNDPEAYYLEVLLPAKIEIYLQSLEDWSPWNDARILMDTILEVARRAGRAFLGGRP